MTKYSDDATWFAFVLQDDLNKSLGFEGRGVKFTNFQVLRETANFCSSILVELEFLSNRDELDYLANSKRNKMLAFLIINSLKKRR